MARSSGWKWLLGLLGVAGLGAAALGGGSASAEANDETPPKVPPIPPPDGEGEPYTGGGAQVPEGEVIELVTADDFAAAQVMTALDPKAGERLREGSTVLLGYSEGWTGKDATLERVVQIAKATPHVLFVVFSFATTRQLFGQPDAPLAFASTAVGPDGVPRAPADQFASTNMGAGALGDARWQALIDFAKNGYPMAPGWKLFTREHGGSAYTILIRREKTGKVSPGWQWLVWKGPRASDVKAVRRGVAPDEGQARAKAVAAIETL